MSAPSTLTPPSLGRGEAGRTGDDVRSDLHVRVEEARGGLDIELRSKVGTLYGEDIRETIRKTMHRLGVTSARVAVDDRGALPWVIQARVEAAARAAGLSRQGTSAAPPPLPGPPPPLSPRDRLRRSRLYL
ncbi:MAG TPA: citrate lyase acyl carrier protein, partial [Longimicrobiales bacterium]|nr:citrate lyase acyl carrier protein [Longimicrobiales bacterium]